MTDVSGAQPEVVFRMLGPLEVWLGGAPVRIGGRRQRALLTMLLLNANRVVARERLIEELIDDVRAETADRTLRVQVWRLRSALTVAGSGEPRLVAPGYRLRVDPGELDVQVFERLVEEGRGAARDGDHDLATRRLHEADALWRGPPLPDVASEPFARSEVDRLVDLRLTAIEERIDADLALGRHYELVPELEGWIGENPLRERLRGQLMLALYRSGRQAEALATYRAGRSRLVEELGIEPGPALRALEQAILQQNPSLSAPAAMVEPEQTAAAGDKPPAPADSRQPRPSRGHHVWRWTAAIVAATAVVAAVAVAPDLGRSARRQHVAVRGDALVLVSVSGHRTEASLKLASAPSDMAAAFGSIWVSEPAAGVLIRVNPATRRVLATIPVGTRPDQLAAGGGSLWALDPATRTVSAIDPAADTVAQTITVPGDPTALAFAAGSLWVADATAGKVSRIDPGTGTVVGTVRTGGNPSALTTSGGSVWVAGDSSGAVSLIAARSGVVERTLRVGDAPAVEAPSTGAAWILDTLDATVSRLDAHARAVAATAAIGGAPTTLAAAGGKLWVGDEKQGVVHALNPQTLTPLATVRLGGAVTSLASDRGLWVAVDARTGAQGGGALRAVGSYAVIDTIDPASSTSWNVPAPQALGLTNDGLVTLDHVGGAAGTRLVPDLATALPLPGNAGRTYTFTLRPGIDYSTGEPVRASDVTHSFERLFAIRSLGASLFSAIRGAAACTRSPAHCDLSHGIVADDQAGTVTFHLVRPDPDFLYKLTVSYAYVLPATTPEREARTPLPATGPYMITHYVPGTTLTLARNPAFHEWSAAAQPTGVPDRIDIDLGLSGARAAGAVAAGQTDFDPNLGGLPSLGARAFAGHHPAQVHAGAAMVTGFLFLNVNVPPFNRVVVRRALNDAYDRTAAVTGWGGSLAAQPVCQLLPPGIAGYRRYCPYTGTPAADGRWAGAAMSRARRLVERSGTRGMKVTVWNATPSPAGSIAETRLAVTALRRLGYRAKLRLLPVSTFYTYTNDSRNRAQVIDGGSGADYASADDFLGKFACRWFVPRDGLDTTDASEFCRPSFDRQVRRAASEQTRDPALADTLWARLDRELTDLAILVPTVTPRNVDLLSARARGYEYNPVWGVLLDQLTVRRGG
jgi:ABC-type transport system substrate-binding protein/DNA-binding SARP family transcriptional activator